MITRARFFTLLAIVTLTLQVCPFNFGSTDLELLAFSTVTNTGLSKITGSVGVYPGTSIVGFPPGITLPIPNNLHIAGSVAQQGQVDALAVYNYGFAQPCTTTYLVPSDIGGLTLTAGVYCFASSAQLTGTVILNAQNNPNAKWIFKAGSTITTSSSAKTILIGGAVPCQILWVAGSSITVGTSSIIHGNMVASASITFTTGSSNNGRIWARNGAVTVDTSITTFPNATFVLSNTTTLLCVSKVFNSSNHLVLTPPSLVTNRTQSYVCQNCSSVNSTTNATSYTNLCAYTNNDIYYVASDCSSPSLVGTGFTIYSQPPPHSLCQSVCKICSSTLPRTCFYKCMTLVVVGVHPCDCTDLIWISVLVIVVAIVALILCFFIWRYFEKRSQSRTQFMQSYGKQSYQQVKQL